VIVRLSKEISSKCESALSVRYMDDEEGVVREKETEKEGVCWSHHRRAGPKLETVCVHLSTRIVVDVVDVFASIKRGEMYTCADV
jgi:hypothetical protein